MKRRTGLDTCCHTCLLEESCPVKQHCSSHDENCHDDQIKFYCAVCQSYKPIIDGKVPDWLKRLAKKLEGKTISLKQMREGLSKCKTSLSDEIIKERDEE